MNEAIETAMVTLENEREAVKQKFQDVLAAMLEQFDDALDSMRKLAGVPSRRTGSTKSAKRGNKQTNKQTNKQSKRRASRRRGASLARRPSAARARPSRRATTRSWRGSKRATPPRRR